MLTRTRSALAFYEEAAGLPLEQRVSKCPWFCRQADALQSTLFSTKKGQAWQTHSAYIAASEMLVVDEQAKTVLRCYAFWRCLECWGALRFSDHRGLIPTECNLTDTAFRGMLTRTKTTGRDKKILNRVLHVDRRCWLLRQDWLEVGWTLWQKSAPWERDFFLPVPTKALEYWERYECRYSEATVLSQVLESQLVLNEEKLLCDDVPGRLWKEHSPRAFLTSCTGCLRYPRNWQDAIGGWSPGQSQAYVRTTRRRIGAMQVRVAQMLREGQGEALGERELEEDLGAFMVKLGYSSQIAQEQVAKLARAREFVAKSQMKRGTLEKDVVVEELEPEEEDEGESEGLEVSGDDGLEWQRVATVVESTGTETRKAEEINMSTVAEVGNVVSEVSVAVAKVSDQEDFPRFAKRVKTRDFAQPALQKLHYSQLDPHGPASSKLQSAQLVSTEKSSSSKSEPAPTKVKRERVGRLPGIIETKPRSQRQMPRPEPVLVPPGYLVANGHKLRCLHYVGRCWRKPERDIKNWQYFGQIQPAASEYDHYCRHCWGKGQLPGDSSEPARAAEDSGSSSTDA